LEIGSISYLTYNLLLLLLSPVLLLLIAQRYFGGKSRDGWHERTGHLPDQLLHRSDSAPRIWVHAVSAGEVVAAVPILKALKNRLPNYDLVLSVTTPAGREMAQQQASKYTAGIFYSPFDLFWIVNRVVRDIKPVAYVSLESELWPNLLHSLVRDGAATVMVNGRISDRSYRRIQRFASGLYRWMLSNVQRLLVQGDADAERLKSLIAGGNTAKVQVIGNSKFDQDVPALTADQVAHLRKSLHLPNVAPVIVAGSTRSAEEEQIVISAYRRLRESFPDLCLIVAPRQLDRAEELSRAMSAVGFECSRRTQLETAPETVRQLILDTMGELANVYAVADVAFVGNSFEPVVKGGGQNLLQPLAHGKPVLFGPRIATIRSEADLAKEHGVGFQVLTEDALVETAAELLRSTELRTDISVRALRLIENNRGVSGRYADEIVNCIGNRTVTNGQSSGSTHG